MKRLDYHQIKSLGTMQCQKINCFDSYIADKYYDLIRDWTHTICRLHNWRKSLSDECTEHIQACYKTTCNWHYVKKYRKVFLGYNEMWLIDRKYIFIYVKRCNWMIYYPLQYFFQAMCCQRPNRIRLCPDFNWIMVALKNP